MNQCIICSDWDDSGEYHPVNCPNCGRYMKWHPETLLYTCVCNGILYSYTTGDAEWDKENEEEGIESPLTICKKPRGWKDEWGNWVLPKKLEELNAINIPNA